MSRKKQKRSKRGKKKKPNKVGKPVAFIEYYQPAFALMHGELEKLGYNPRLPHPKRESFWQLIADGIYEPYRARPLVEEYLKSLEKEMADLIGKHSIAYWLHLYRRLLPGPIGQDMQPTTILMTRAVLEATIQKYAQIEPCNGVGISNEIPEENILDGMLMHPDWKNIRQGIKKTPQLVLTKFGLQELKEFYDIERLAYEVWRSGALLRILGKGSLLIVDNDSEEFVYDDRTDELDELIMIYDERIGGGRHLTATGTVFSDETSAEQVLLSFYDVKGASSEIFSEACKVFGLLFPEDSRTNFIWFPYNLRGFLEAHQPFALAFEEEHGLSLETVLSVVASLLYRCFHQIQELPGPWLVKYWQRAYEGPYKKEYIHDEIRRFLPWASTLLGLEGDGSDIDVAEGLSFLELSDESRGSIDIVYPGPHMIFLPYGEDRMFIDYAWIQQRLYYFFFGINIPDQNFKGDALEELVHKGRSVLPTTPCKSLNGGMKQIDAAFEVGDTLIIVECKVMGRSIGFDRGNQEAINYRCKKIEEALSEVDEKARWLANNPIGTNYDIRRFLRILPIASTPFAEYIPTLNNKYWLKDRLPRVLTPAELESALEDGTLEKLAPLCPNSVLISPTRN